MRSCCALLTRAIFHTAVSGLRMRNPDPRDARPRRDRAAVCRRANALSVTRRRTALGAANGSGASIALGGSTHFAEPFDAGPLAMSTLAVALLLAGYPSEAQRLSDNALEVAAQLGKPSNIAFCSVNVAAMY